MRTYQLEANNFAERIRSTAGDGPFAGKTSKKKKKRHDKGRGKRLKHRPTSAAQQTSDAFLASYEWRKVRMQALKKHGARCQCCGATPADGAVMNVDHIKPRALYPSLALSLDNLQVLCGACNHGKGNWDMTDWRDKDAIAHLRSIAQE